jgi:hypothetical protein
MRWNRKNGILGLILIAVSAGACEDLLTVSDPQAYTSSDLDFALPAIANGVEGTVHEVMDNFVIYQSLLADVYQHTGTWSSYDETDHGRFQYGTSPLDGTHNAWLRSRWFANNAADRITRVMEGAAATDPMLAQVKMSEALADLMIGMTFCESPLVPSGPVATDQANLEQAVTNFAEAISVAKAANNSEYEYASIAGMAEAHLLLGNYASAAAEAAKIPAGFSYDAIYNEEDTNSIVQLTTKGFNEAAGLMYKWWPQIDRTTTQSSYMRDPLTNEPDPRIPVYFDGEVATDNETPHYSQYKYQLATVDIPFLHADGMRLIEAEAKYRTGDYSGMTTILNTLRAAVGLTAFAVPTDDATAQSYLLNERFAEHFMEGRRRNDLHRFGLMKSVFAALNDGAGDSERPASGRPTKFSMTDTEPTYNVNINNDLMQRCLPKT